MRGRRGNTWIQRCVSLRRGRGQSGAGARRSPRERGAPEGRPAGCAGGQERPRRGMDLGPREEGCRRSADTLGPKGPPLLTRWRGAGGLAARSSYRRNWSRDRSADRSPGCSTARPFSFPTVTGKGQAPGTARGCVSHSRVASTGLTTEAATGFRRRSVAFQEPSRIFRSRRRRGNGKRRR